MIQSGVNYDSFVGSSSGSIVAGLLATNNLDQENIEWFLEGMPEKVKPSELGNILLIKLIPFFLDMEENGRMLDVQEKKILATGCMKYVKTVEFFSKGEVDLDTIMLVIGKITNRTIQVKKQSFVDVVKRYGKQLSVNTTVLARRKNKTTGTQIIAQPHSLELRGGYPIIDGILHSCGASGLLSKKKIKKLSLMTFDSVFSGGQYANDFTSKKENYTNVLIHTDWFFGITRLLLPGYGKNNYIIAPRLFGTDCYNYSEKSVTQLKQIAQDMIRSGTTSP